MGMTIDEAIIQAILLKDGVGKDTYKYEILTSLINIAKKYQKIEQMLYEFKDMTYAPCLMKGHMCAVHEILNEVVEDGKID